MFASFCQFDGVLIVVSKADKLSKFDEFISQCLSRVSTLTRDAILSVRPSEWRRDSAHFPLMAVTSYRSHAVRRVEIIGYFYSSDTQYSSAYFTVKRITS